MSVASSNPLPASSGPRERETSSSSADRLDLAGYLEECRGLAVEEIRGFIPRGSAVRPILYDLMLDYPLRGAKGLRPALCIAACRALGGRLHSALRTAAVIELYHNAFLIHDDVEDGSDKRRDAPTLHRLHGAPQAINVGDAMLALALQPLLDNMRDLGVGTALEVLQIVARMARESAEGQAIELAWIARGAYDLRDRDYVRMVHKKTGWYTFIAPTIAGATIAGADRSLLRRLGRFAAMVGIGFQIQDDVLNLTGAESRTGKEAMGDIWEGKYTLMLLHLLRIAGPEEQRLLRRILGKRRPPSPSATPGAHGSSSDHAAEVLDRLRATLAEKVARALIAPETASEILRSAEEPDRDRYRTEDDVHEVFALMRHHGSVDHARSVAGLYARRARRELDQLHRDIAPSVHRDFLAALVDYVVQRDR
jgi:geranylgeranyl diphosphate synthase type II